MPMVAAMVAVAMICSMAERSPEKISGSAQGTSTRASTWVPFMPIPRAASRAAGSTLSTPA